jgi:lipopolysaccharide transport system permease protein
MTAAERHTPEVVIRPRTGIHGVSLKELWAYRELLYYLTWRNVLVRYKQTAFGIAWAVVQPFTMMVVFTVIFHRVANIGSDGVPYPIFAYSALLPWTMFASALTQASLSVVGNSNLIGKVYFPRLTLPISAVLTALVDFAISFLVLVGMMAYYLVSPHWSLLPILLLLLLLAFVAALGVGLWLAAINVAFRDVQYVIPFLVQVWFFATPVVYSTSLVGEPWRTVFGLNPMAGVITGFRWILLDSNTRPGWMVGVSVLVALVVLVTGALNFRRLERTFADVV